MASSDDEGETLPDAVSDYYFCDGEDEPLSFVKLPVQWNENERSTSNAQPIFLSGTADNGLQKLYKQVKAWKFDFSKANPEILVLYQDNHWFKLQKPRKSYEKEIRTILITVQCLHFFKSEPEASGKSLWDHLSKVFRYLYLSVQLVYNLYFYDCISFLGPSLSIFADCMMSGPRRMT